MKLKNQRKTKTKTKKGGGCGCGNGNGNSIFSTNKTGGCAYCSKIEGGGFTISPTAQPQHYYPLNNYNHDPMMQTNSSRIEGVPISNNLNVTGGNDIVMRGGKKKRKNQKSKKSKLKKSKRTKKQRGGINLGYIGQNSLLGHGHYGTWFGAPTTNTPDWNASIFTSPINQNNTGYSQYNPYLV